MKEVKKNNLLNEKKVVWVGETPGKSLREAKSRVDRPGKSSRESKSRVDTDTGPDEATAE